MTEPRNPRPDELPALIDLVNGVFNLSPLDPSMLDQFPTLFAESNLSNLFVFEEESNLACHVGMKMYEARIGGAPIKVACVGAVATREISRGRGHASTLMDRAISYARFKGAELMMISGGRGLYRRLGAADVGLDYEVMVEKEVADRLRVDDLEIKAFEPSDIETCDRRYRTKEAHFVRTPDEWEVLANAPYCVCARTDTWTLRKQGERLGYLAVSAEEVGSVTERGMALTVFEFASDPVSVAGSLSPLLDRTGSSRIRISLQSEDRELLDLLVGAGAQSLPIPMDGTLLTLEPARLLEKVASGIEKETGWKVSGVGSEERLVVTMKGPSEATVELEGREDISQFLFGNHEAPPLEEPFARIFPLPILRYGLNFI